MAFLRRLLASAPRGSAAPVGAPPASGVARCRAAWTGGAGWGRVGLLGGHRGRLGTGGVWKAGRRPDVTMATVDAYLHNLYRTPGDFVYSVSRDFVRACQTPMLIMPDDVPAHPYTVCVDIAALAPQAQVTMYPWKEPKDLIPLAVRHVRDFLRAHQPVSSAH